MKVVLRRSSREGLTVSISLEMSNKMEKLTGNESAEIALANCRWACRNRAQRKDVEHGLCAQRGRRRAAENKRAALGTAGQRSR